ncbi:hypothetical protein MJO29_003923 [Puccinia striiformis f. sp. tritici]|uniref:hypothetical protein n=1 Tax=Puccinia striiformis f. sp. tritici TaxID=168172 RepID=UPI00200752BB|nr:hypothetical protein Pst134EA_007052 [Puccinia striiformis f. sp. tritici]KAH9469775.1 hypothetical protein Pst134EA_007052 [Puccinia striiformis f. sp. tritici]KAI7963496.1 hypothetical protein MJO29_003923 [Puccinia striiformis f. sp. tritici]KAI9617375.1 hypothetical protein KEM48_004827 [Puccinia striiformis f. sp. tritici PST-130]
MLHPGQQSSNQPQASSSSTSHLDTVPQDDDTHSEELAQLSAQLVSAGFLRQSLPADTLNGGSIEGQKHLIKAVWSMVASRSKEMSIREGLMAKQRELSYEHTRLEGFLERAEKEKLEAQQEATASTNRANAAQKELELEKARHRKTRDDYTKLKNAERLIKTTSVHELRKKNNELDELQRRLTKLSSSKDLPLPSSLNWTSSAPLVTRVDTEGGGRVGLLEFDLKASRAQNNQLQIDNSRLREYLGLYEQQLIDLISEISNHNDLQTSIFELDDNEPIDDEVGYINTPHSNVPLPKIYKRLSLVTYKLRERVLEVVHLVEELRTKLTEISSATEQERIKSQKEIGKMRTHFEKEIEMLKLSLKEAEATLEGWAHTGLASGSAHANGMEDVTFERSLEITQPKIQMQVEALSLERKKLAKEAIELSRQRAEMEMRKLNEEREKILRELEMNPTPKQSGSLSKSNNSQTPVAAEAEVERGNETLESLVVYTKPKNTTTARTLPTRTCKPRSSISKGLGTVHRVKQHIPASSTSRLAPTRNRTAVLKSLLSITGEEGGVVGTSTGTTDSRSATNSKPTTLPKKPLNTSVAGPSSSSASRLRNSKLGPQTRFNLGKSSSRITRPPR